MLSSFSYIDSKLFDGSKYQPNPQNDKIQFTLLMWESQKQNRVGGRRQLAIPSYSTDFVMAIRPVKPGWEGRRGEETLPRTSCFIWVRTAFRRHWCRSLPWSLLSSPYIEVLPAFLAHRREVWNLQLRWQMRKALTNDVETSPASTDANGKATTLPSFPNPLVLCYGVQWIFF